MMIFIMLLVTGIQPRMEVFACVNNTHAVSEGLNTVNIIISLDMNAVQHLHKKCGLMSMVNVSSPHDSSIAEPS